ncbi:MAG: hypothetical protein RLZZ303_2678 [Candidatus Hydrogenedentota bacterium]|jgi:glycosyltransferase involved in cell wall biosynthesis
MTRTRIPVVIAAADIESGVTSWALRFRDYCANDPELEVTALNCWRTGKGVGRFDAEITTERAMRRYLRQRPDAVVVPNFVWELFPLCAELAGQGLPLRTIGYARSDSSAEYYDPLAWIEPLAGAFLASSEECAEHLRQRLPHRAAEIHAAPSGVIVPERLARRWQTAPLRLVYAGRLVQEQKRVIDFIPLVAGLLERGVKFELTLIGAGRESAELQRGFDALPHGGRVRIRPAVPWDAMPEIWSNCDVFVLLSDYEGTSSSMLEAMAQGCVPVVTESSSGVRGVVQHGHSGFILPVGAMELMADQIASLAALPAQVEAVGRAAHGAVAPFAMPRYRETFLRAVAQARSHPPCAWPNGDRRAGLWRKGGGLGTPLEGRHRFLSPGWLAGARQRLGL